MALIFDPKWQTNENYKLKLKYTIYFISSYVTNVCIEDKLENIHNREDQVRSPQ